MVLDHVEERVFAAIRVGCSMAERIGTWVNKHGGGAVTYRDVDNALKRLKRKGLISYTRADGWKKVGA